MTWIQSENYPTERSVIQRNGMVSSDLSILKRGGNFCSLDAIGERASSSSTEGVGLDTLLRSLSYSNDVEVPPFVERDILHPFYPGWLPRRVLNPKTVDCRQHLVSVGVARLLGLEDNMSEELQDREEDAVQPTLEAMDLQQLEDSWQPTRTPVHYLAGFLLLGVVVAYLLTQSLPPGYNLLDMLYQ